MLCFRPTTPLAAAGMRVEPPPSVAMPIGPMPAAIATAAPPLEPADVRSAKVELEVTGPDQFRLRGSSDLSKISRDPTDLVAHAMGKLHQYPDGMVLMTGTLFAPTEQRKPGGHGFTHMVGDLVSIRSPKLGTLTNRVNHCDKIAPWTFGASALMRNLAGRGLLK